MGSPHIESLLLEAERRALVLVLRSHPEWTFEQIMQMASGPHARALRQLTVRELLSDPDIDPGLIAPGGGPPINQWRLARAQNVTGVEFDRYVLEVLVEAGKAVSAGYVRTRVGGPRWKLQASFRRLVAEGAIERQGNTSATRYRVNTRGIL